VSNFTFLTTSWPDLCATAIEAEQNINSTPRTSCFYSRRSLEIAIKYAGPIFSVVAFFARTHRRFS